MKNPKSFYKKLKKLIEEECPDDCEVVFDSMKCALFVVKTKREFYHKNYNTGATIGSTTPKNSMGHDSNEGILRKYVINDDGIDIDMQAVQEI